MSRYWDDYLCHYGRKGMKWGQHIFSRTSSKKSSRNRKAFNAIYNSLDVNDKMKVTGARNESQIDKELMSSLMYDRYVAKNFVTRVGSKPVSALAVEKLNDRQASISLLTDPKQRGKGFASTATNKAMNWIEKGSSFTEVYWDVRADNIGSRRIAEKHGFKEDYKTSDGWISYSKSINRKKSK